LHISAKLFFYAGKDGRRFSEKDEHPTSNVQHRPSEIEKKFHGVKMMNRKTNLEQRMVFEEKEIVIQVLMSDF